MRTEFQLEGSRLKPRHVPRVLGEWAQSSGGLLGEPRLGRRGPVTEYEVAFEGSIRGVHMALVPGRPPHLVASLGALASRVDWMRTFDALSHLIERGGGEVRDADGELLELPQLSQQDAAAFGMQRLIADTELVAGEFRSRGRPWLALPALDHDLLVLPSDLPDETDSRQVALELESALAERAGRYHGALRLAAQQAGDGTLYLIWPFEPAIVHHPVPIVVPDLRGGTARVVAWPAVASILGERLESVSRAENVFFLDGLGSGRAEDEALGHALADAGMAYQEWIESHAASEH